MKSRKAIRGGRPEKVSAKTQWECAVCHATFKAQRGLNDHFAAKHAHPQAPEIIRPPVCIECGGASTLTDGRELYPHRPDLYRLWFYKCTCGAYCGCHEGTKRALGNPAGPKTRAARKRAHSAFDPIWRDKPKYGVMRKRAYQMLADALHIHSSDCHIGMMNAETADRVTQWAYEWRASFDGKA